MTDFVEIDEFFSHLRPDLMNCPEIIMANHVRSAVIDMCEHTPIWQYENPAITVIADVRDYCLTMPHEDARMHSVLGAWSGNRIMDHASHSDLASQPGRRANQEALSVSAYSIDSRGSIKLFGKPRGELADNLLFNVSLKPSRKAEEVPSQFYDDYFDTIIEGALGRAMCMVDRDWTNLDLSDKHLSRYSRGRASARMAVERGLMHHQGRLKRRQFVAGRNYI